MAAQYGNRTIFFMDDSPGMNRTIFPYNRLDDDGILLDDRAWHDNGIDDAGSFFYGDTIEITEFDTWPKMADPSAMRELLTLPFGPMMCGGID